MRGTESTSKPLRNEGYISYLLLKQLAKGKASIDVENQAFRLGTHEYELAAFNYARLEPLGNPRSRNLVLRFGIEGDIDFYVTLTKASVVVIEPQTVERLVALFASSSIDIPIDEFDPEGKFARSGSPTHVTRDEAIALVLDPPMPGDPLPIIWP